MGNTDVVDKHSILSRFITRGIKDLYERFNAISEEESERVKKFIFEIEGKIEFDVYKDYDLIKELAEKLDNVSNVDGIKLYIFLTQELGLELTVEDVRAYYQDLESEGYIMIDKYLFYLDTREDEIVELVKDDFESALDYEETLMEFFTFQEVCEMWIFKKEARAVARDYIEENGWEEYVGAFDVDVAYTDEYGCFVNYCTVDKGCDLFEISED